MLLASNSITGQPGWDAGLAKTCLADDEAAARDAVAGLEAVMVYPATKAALARWARSGRGRPGLGRAPASGSTPWRRA